MFEEIVSGVFAVLEAVTFAIFDGLLTVIYLIFSAFDLSGLFFETASDWMGLPDQLVWLITELGLPQCLSIFGFALGIRMLFNLLPASVTRI